MSQLANEASGDAGMLSGESSVAWRLSVGVAALMRLQSVTGVVFPELYRDVASLLWASRPSFCSA